MNTNFCNEGDASASSCLNEAESDERVKMSVEMEDPDIVYDLCEVQSGRKSKFDTFGINVKSFSRKMPG